MEPVIQISNATVELGGRPVLSKLDFGLERGALTVLVGASGCGKTTLMRLLTGELEPATGSVQVGPNEVGMLRAARRARYRRAIGIVAEHIPLLDDRNTEAQLLLPLELSGMARRRRKERAAQLLERFDLVDARRVYPPDLSMGMRKRVAIARAVAREPLVLLADEPAAHLDTAAAREIAQIFQRENLRGMTILIATSDEQFASRFPGKCIVPFPGA